jgi:hypothetical protein
MDNGLQLIRDNLSIVTLCAIALGYFDGYSYYIQYGVNIYYYQDVSEIIFSFSSLFYILLTLGIGMFITLPFRPKGHFYNRFITSIKAENDPEEKQNRFREFLKTQRIMGAILIFMMIASAGITIFTVTFATISEGEIFAIWIHSVLFIYIVLSIASFRDQLENIDFSKSAAEIDQTIINGRTGRHRAFSLYILVTFLVLILARNSIKYRNVISGKPTHKISFHHGDNSVKSSSSYYYIGATKNYIFMYDSTRKEVDVYPEREIPLSSIKRVRKGI